MITKAASARPSTSSSNCRRRSGSSWPNCASSKKRSSRASSSGRRTAMPAKLERSSNPFLVPKNSRGPVALPCPNRPFSLTEPKVSQRYQLSSANQSINQSINQSTNQLTNQSINQPINQSTNQSAARVPNIALERCALLFTASTFHLVLI